MANQEHLDILEQGVDAWNAWLNEHIEIKPDLRKADLKERDLRGAFLIEADLSYANLREAYLDGADLERANLKKANLREADLNGVNLKDADLSGAFLRYTDLNDANLEGANLKGAKLSGAFMTGARLRNANLCGADLSGAFLIGADFTSADLTGACLNSAALMEAKLNRANLCLADLSYADLQYATLIGTVALGTTFFDCKVYGISAWDIQLDGEDQFDLIITPDGQPVVTVDSLEVAQFIYLLLNNAKIRNTIDAIARKAVLILGRFTSERKSVLEAIKMYLRAQGYLPILFDFPKPESQDLTGTVSTLASISRFIIADLTDPSCSPYEIGLIAPCMKPIKPLFQPSEAAKREFAMFQDLRKRYSPWLLSVCYYKDQDSLIASLQEKVIVPAEKMVQLLEKRKRR